MLRYKAPLRNRISMADKKVNATKIQAALKGHKGIVTNVDEFHDRFLFDTWYLWACFKDIDNGRRVILFG
jgi:hypothetical protein